MWKRAWQAWKKIARHIGNFQARVLLTLFYVTLILPFGVPVRFLSDRLRIKRRSAFWLDHPDDAYDLKWARKQ